jgi:hypothetical protein
MPNAQSPAVPHLDEIAAAGSERAHDALVGPGGLDLPGERLLEHVLAGAGHGGDDDREEGESG